MKNQLKLFGIAALIIRACFAAPELPQVDGTTGTPLGGFGTGAVKFCGNSGAFAFSSVAPTRCGNYASLPANFAFFSSRGSTVATSAKLIAQSANSRYDDDAIFPIQKANFGAVGGVNIRLLGSCPWDVQDSNRMIYPCALFEFTVANTQGTPVDVAVGFKMTSANTPVIVPNRGWKDENNAIQKAIYAKSSDASAIISVGGDANFLTTGLCSGSANGTSNMVAVKVTLAANEIKTLKFVFAWYNKTTVADYYYTNLFSGAGSVADSGLSNFDLFKTNAETFVTRMRSSNVPDWLVNSALNSLCTFTNNSKYMKDGRIMFAEGKWGCLGTMDQMWHARQAVSQIMPYFVWKELEYWARTQKTDPAALGQIHHDLQNGCADVPAAWDQTTWIDYRDIDDWVDLNCGFIINVYETFMATNDLQKLDYFWPYVLKAGNRILTQAKTQGNTSYPYTFASGGCSYDWGTGAGVPEQFNSSLSIAAYKIMSKLATIKNDPAAKARFDGARDTAVTNFKKRYIDAIFPTGNMCEGIGAGPWLSDFLKLGHDFSSADIDKIVDRLNGFYNPLVNGCGTLFNGQTVNFGVNYHVWQWYIIPHYADLALIAGKKDIWYALRHDTYLRDYEDRNRVFDLDLGAYPSVTKNYKATNTSGSTCYMSQPSLFRDYYTIIGYQRNKNTGELWLEPNLPESMNDTLKNGYYVSPEGNGTIDFTQNPSTQEQRIVFKPDNPVQVTTIYIKDKYGATVPPVWVNKTRISSANVTRIGMGYGKELKINWSGLAQPAGLTVEAAQDVSTAPTGNYSPGKAGVTISGNRSIIRYMLHEEGPVSIEVFRLNGCKVWGLSENKSAGMHELAVDRLFTKANSFSGSPYLLRITANNQSKLFKIMRGSKGASISHSLTPGK